MDALLRGDNKDEGLIGLFLCQHNLCYLQGENNFHSVCLDQDSI